MKSMPHLYGLNEEQINKMSEISVQIIKGIHCMSIVFGVAERRAILENYSGYTGG